MGGSSSGGLVRWETEARGSANARGAEGRILARDETFAAPEPATHATRMRTSPAEKGPGLRNGPLVAELGAFPDPHSHHIQAPGFGMSDTLQVTLRSTTGTREARRLRRTGMVPAILYGHGEECVGLAAKQDALLLAIRHESRIVNLEGAVKTAALIRELQWDTYGKEPIHVDFIRVDASERIHVKVPVDLKGECPGQKAGGIVNLVMHEIDLECAADHVPERVHAQVGNLEVGHAIKVRDLELPAGVQARADADETVVTCTLPGKKVHEEATAPAEPEVVGRKAEEGEAAAE
jgi:large subunit ribosomal protein L25